VAIASGTGSGGRPIGRGDSFPSLRDLRAPLVSAELLDGFDVEEEHPCEPAVADSLFFVEVADGCDDFVRDRGIVVCLPDALAVLVDGDEARHFRRAFLRVSARLNFFATDIGTPTFFANFAECAAAAIKRR